MLHVNIMLSTLATTICQQYHLSKSWTAINMEESSVIIICFGMSLSVAFAFEGNFPMLKPMPPYCLHRQWQIVIAACTPP